MLRIILILFIVNIYFNIGKANDFKTINNTVKFIEVFNNEGLFINSLSKTKEIASLNNNSFANKHPNYYYNWNHQPVILFTKIHFSFLSSKSIKTFAISILFLTLLILYLKKYNELTKHKINLKKEVNKRTNSLREANDELSIQKEEILAQNREIYQQSEELASQRDSLNIQNKKLKSAYDNIRLFSELGQRLSLTINLNSIHKLVYTYVKPLIDVSAFGIGLLNKERQIIEFPQFFENDKTHQYFNLSLKDKKSIFTWSIKNKKFVHLNNNQEEDIDFIPPLQNFNISFSPQSILIVPLIADKKVIGLITSISKNYDGYGKKELDNLISLSSYISIAFDNVKVYEVVNEQNKILKNSFEYAFATHKSILPTKTYIEKFFETFVVFKPKEVISGDYYWFLKTKDKDDKQIFFTAVIDCVGNGILGAYLTLISYRLLNEIINQKLEHNPSKILEYLNLGLQMTLNQEENINDDSLDISLCKIEKPKKSKQTKVTFSGAKHSIIYSKNTSDEIIRLKGDRKSIGGLRSISSNIKFTNQEFILNKGDTIYLYSDGILLQNNSNRDKLGTQKLILILKSINELPLNTQKQILEEKLMKYMLNEKQRDDITLFGIRI